MTLYRAYFIGADGRIHSAIDLDCDNDEAAEDAAKQLVDGHDVEVWQRDRGIGKLNAEKR